MWTYLLKYDKVYQVDEGWDFKIDDVRYFLIISI